MPRNPAAREAGSPPREYPARPIVGVGAVVLIGREEPVRFDRGHVGGDYAVLLVRRRFEPLAGQWSLPGGTLEVGETLEAGVAREVAEETGLRVAVGQVADVVDRILFDAGGRVQYHFVLIDYVCRPAGGRLLAASDALEVAIADPGALDSFGLSPEVRAVIGRAIGMTRAQESGSRDAAG